MRSVLKILLIITLLELFLGGGGRIFEIGIGTLRMLLFFLNIILVCFFYIERNKFPNYILTFCFVIFTVLIFYSILGWLNGAKLSLIAEDVKPLSYFFSILFFNFYLDSVDRVKLVVSILKKTSVFMALAYIIVQILFFLGKIDFTTFYEYTNTHISPSDFIFRGVNGLFFYKGFLYMIIGLIFWIHTSKSKFKAIAIIIIMTAMILTGTRGFILIFGLIYALAYGVPMLLKLNVKLIILSLFLVVGSLYFFRNFEIGDKAISDSIRIQQIKQVFENINPISFFIGHGFGVGVPIRKVHMEIGYLEVFHKQGILGLSIWAVFYLILYNTRIKKQNFKEIRKAMLLSVIFIAILSFTNPFFNNPIGISLFMIVYAALKVLNREKNRPNHVQ